MSPTRSKKLSSEEWSALTASDLFDADADLAVRLWKDGFRPKPAEALVKGDRVAYVRTLFGLPTSSEIETAVVRSAERRDCSIFIEHGDDLTESDEHGEVWAK